MTKAKMEPPIKESDRLFFLGFYEKYKNFMFYIASRYASTQHDCEDIMQEALVRLLKNIPTLKELTHYKSAKYIVVTIRTAYIDCEARKHHVETVALEDYREEFLFAKEDSQNEPPELLYYLEMKKLKSELSPRDWAALEGKYILGYSQEELSQLLNVAPDSIRMILCRAKARARRILGKNPMDGGEDND